MYCCCETPSNPVTAGSVLVEESSLGVALLLLLLMLVGFEPGGVPVLKPVLLLLLVVLLLAKVSCWGCSSMDVQASNVSYMISW
jgi:hypothetical protein